MTHTTIRDAADFISRRDPFDAGSLTGRLVRWTPSTGRLPSEWEANLETCVGYWRERGQETYVVSSYGTPIAWAGGEDSLLVPNVRYSVTTSKHQSVCRRGA